jgi:hypothetical protein
MAMSDSSLKLLDIIVKGVLGAVVTILVTLYGLHMQRQSERQTSLQQKAQGIIDLESKQKDLDVQIAVDMFQSLIGTYVQASGSKFDEVELRRRLLLLRLVALNFQDVPIQLRPLFEDLDKQLTQDQDKQALRDIALEVASRQAFRLTIGGIFNSGPIPVTKDQKIPITELGPTTFVIIDAVSAESIQAHIESGLALAGTVGPFTVNYFAWPITDNTKLQQYRLAVMLLAGGERQATIRIIAFDSELAADRFDIKELAAILRQKDYSAP